MSNRAIIQTENLDELKWRYQDLEEEKRKLFIEEKVLEKKLEMIEFNKFRAKVSDLRYLLALWVEYGHPHDFQEKNRLAQNLLDNKIQEYALEPDLTSIFQNNDNKLVPVPLLVLDSQILIPILDKVRNMTSIMNWWHKPKIDPPPFEF